MELNFRLILIIISVVAICGIYINGRYKIRKNPYKLKTKNTAKQDANKEQERQYDSEGFDQDGIRRIKTVVDEPTEPLTVPEDMPIPPVVSSEEVLNQRTSLEDIETLENSFTPVADDLDFHDEPAVRAKVEEQLDADIQNTIPTEAATISPTASDTKTPEVSTPVYKNPVESNRRQNSTTQPEDSVNVNQKVTSIKKPVQKSKAELKRDQLALDFEEQPQTKVEIEQEVLALSVVCSNQSVINGAALLPQLITLGLKFGEMNIFHRHKDNAGNGPIHFSLANMVNPGTFDVDKMEQFSTQGLTLFMTLPNAGDPAKVFQLMLSAAKQLAVEFNGQVLDSKRSVMTAQTEQHYITKIREFDRRSRLAKF